MQAEFNEESTKLNERICELEKECDRYKTVIHRLSNKVEAANAAGFAGKYSQPVCVSYMEAYIYTKKTYM